MASKEGEDEILEFVFVFAHNKQAERTGKGKGGEGFSGHKEIITGRRRAVD